MVYSFGVDGRGGTMYQETIHSYSQSCVSIVDVEGRGGYRSHNTHYLSRLLGVHGRFTGLSFPSRPLD